MSNLKQINHVTKKQYSNTNHQHLTDTFLAKSFKSNEWVTKKQARAVKLTVKKGEQGIPLIRMVTATDTKTKKKIFIPLYFTVFNLDQTEQLTEALTK